MTDSNKIRLIGAGFIIGWLIFSISALALAAYAVAKAVSFAGVCA